MSILHRSLLLPLFFCIDTGLISTPSKHLMPSPLPVAYMHSVHHTHTTTPNTQHHKIHACTSDVQHIHLQRVYNTVHPSISDVQYHPIHVPTQIATQRIHTMQCQEYIMHIHNTTCP